MIFEEAQPKPIKATVDLTNETGLIRISFSRAIVINLDAEVATESAGKQADGSLSQGVTTGGSRRQLRETYTEEEKVALAKIIKVDYQTDTEEDQEKSIVTDKVVTFASDRVIELQLTFSLPAAVSRDSIDKIVIEFDEAIWNDPLTDI